MDSYTISEMGQKFAKGKAYNQEFCNIFCPARLSQYYQPIFGFDIVGFDENVIHTPDGESMANCLTEKYGLRAHEIIKTLITL